MALTFIYVHRGQGSLMRIIAMPNVTMLLATILCGAHYLTDLLGGAVVTAASIAIVRLINADSLKRWRQAIGQPASPPI